MKKKDASLKIKVKTLRDDIGAPNTQGGLEQYCLQFITELFHQTLENDSTLENHPMQQKFHLWKECSLGRLVEVSQEEFTTNENNIFEGERITNRFKTNDKHHFHLRPQYKKLFDDAKDLIKSCNSIEETDTELILDFEVTGSSLINFIPESIEWKSIAINVLSMYEIIKFDNIIIPKGKNGEAYPNLDKKDTQSLFSFLESGDQSLIDFAFSVIYKDEEVKNSVNKRYLNFVRAVLQNEKAEVHQFSFTTGDSLYELVYNSFLENRIELVELSGIDARKIIDTMGAIVKNHMDIDFYIQKAKNIKTLKEFDFYFEQRSKLTNGLRNGEQDCQEGWFGKLNRLLGFMLYNGLDVGLILWRTPFKLANQSPVLKEFLFAVYAAQKKENLFVEIRNVMDEPLHLTEMIYLAQQMPAIMWPKGQNLTIAKSEFAFERTVPIMKDIEGFDRANIDHNVINKKHSWKFYTQQELEKLGAFKK